MKYLLFILIPIFFFSCNDTTHYDRDLAVYGTVIDSEGNPVANAEVVVIPEITASPSGIINSGNENLLAVELSYFQASEKNDNIEINWETASEMNSLKFVIEKAIGANGEYIAIDSLDAAGNSNSAQNYSYNDFDVLPGQLYKYRLKLVSMDGSFEYSNAVIIETFPIGAILSENYPNPFATNTSINYSVKGYEHYLEFIERSTGTIYAKTETQSSIGPFSYDFAEKVDGKILRPGIYDCNLHFEDSVITSEMYLSFLFDSTNCIIPLEVTKTDENGLFKITYNYFPDDYKGNLTDVTGQVIGSISTTGNSDIIVRKQTDEDNNSVTYLLSQDRIFVDKTIIKEITCNAKEVSITK